MNADQAWEAFEQNPENGRHAMDALIALAKNGEQIPDELLPWLEKACTAWTEAKGNKRKPRAADTAIKWRSATMGVVLRHKAGMSVTDAIWEVSNKISCGDGTLHTRYYGNAECKEVRELLDDLDQDQAENYMRVLAEENLIP